MLAAAASDAPGAEGSGPVDLVLMDIEMARMDGVAAVREMRMVGSAIPVVATTGNSDAAMAADCERTKTHKFTMCTHTRARTHTLKHTHTHTHTHKTQTHTHTHTNTNTNAHTHTRTHKHTNTHIHTQTDTQTPASTLSYICALT